MFKIKMAIENTEKIVKPEILPSYAEAKKLKNQLKNDPEIDFISFCGSNNIYQILNKEFVSELVKFLQDLNRRSNDETPILEVCAGNGKLSYQLRKKGINVLATDDYSYDDMERQKNLVERLNHIQALEKYKPKIVLASWIPYMSKLGIDVFRYPSVKHLIMIGEGNHGCCGFDEIYEIANHKTIKEVNKYSLAKTDVSTAELFTKESD